MVTVAGLERRPLLEEVKSRGIRLTAQRRVLIEEMQNADRHLDAALLYERARRRDARVDLATVYRTLGMLKRMGLIDELDLMHLNGEKHYYEARTSRDHVHLACFTCGKIEEFTTPSYDRLKEEIQERCGFLSKSCASKSEDGADRARNRAGVNSSVCPDPGAQLLAEQRPGLVDRQPMGCDLPHCRLPVPKIQKRAICKWLAGEDEYSEDQDQDTDEKKEPEQEEHEIMAGQIDLLGGHGYIGGVHCDRRQPGERLCARGSRHSQPRHSQPLKPKEIFPSAVSIFRPGLSARC